MPVVAVVNRKGGCGKSTLAAHLAAHLSRGGVTAMLGDLDRGRSATTWLRLRQAQGRLPGTPILGWTLDTDHVFRRPVGVSHVVLDTPSGLHGFELARVACYADAIVMPLCNSVFDRTSARECLAELLTMPRVASGRCKVAAVGMRLDARTRAADVVQAWAAQQRVDYLGALRETQAYVRCIEQGLSLFDLPEHKVAAGLLQWAPVLGWLHPVWHPQPVQPAEPARPHARTPPVLKPRPLGITIPGMLDELPAARSGVPSTGVAAPAVAVAAQGLQVQPPSHAPAASTGWGELLGQMWQALPLGRLRARQH